MTRSSSATELRTLGEGSEFPEGPVALGEDLVLRVADVRRRPNLTASHEEYCNGYISLTRTVTAKGNLTDSESGSETVTERLGHGALD
jgi:hypothetical protein